MYSVVTYIYICLSVTSFFTQNEIQNSYRGVKPLPKLFLYSCDLTPLCSLCSSHNGLFALHQIGPVFSCLRLLAFAPLSPPYTLALDICQPHSLISLCFLLKWHWIKSPRSSYQKRRLLFPGSFYLVYLLQSVSTVNALFIIFIFCAYPPIRMKLQRVFVPW